MTIMFRLICDRCGLVDTFAEQQLDQVHSVRLDNVHYNLCTDCYELMGEIMAEGARQDATDNL
jgi:hypothetical protein